MTPKFYNDPVFTVVEAAEVAGAAESAFRSMLARGGAKHVGIYRRGRTLFTCHELVIATLAVQLASFGMMAETAWQTAHSFAGGDTGMAPEPESMARIHNHDGAMIVAMSYDGKPLPPIAASSVSVPIAAIWRSVVDRAAALYAMGG